MKIFLGKVVSIKSNKTVKVLVKKIFKNFFNKNIYKVKKYLVHDDLKICSLDEYVYIIQSKPISKKKFWKIFYF